MRISEEWARYHGGSIKALVKNDTLFIDFDFVPKNTYEKYWMRNITAVRIFSRELLSVNGFNTNLEMHTMKQNNYTISMTGRSRFEVESMQPTLDSLNISQKDSSMVIFEMSPEYKSPATPAPKPEVNTLTVTFGKNDLASQDEPIKSRETMTLRTLVADVQGVSLLDVGHAQIGSLQLSIADSSAILLSGGALKKVK